MWPFVIKGNYICLNKIEKCSCLLFNHDKTPTASHLPARGSDAPPCVQSLTCSRGKAGENKMETSIGD